MFNRKKNSRFTSKETIQKQMGELRPLPMGRKEFEEWSDRIIAGALVSADVNSQKWTLANLILHLGPTEDHKEDAFFIHSLRKLAANQVADAIRTELREEAKARLAREEEEKKIKLVSEKPPCNEAKILPNQSIQGITN